MVLFGKRVVVFREQNKARWKLRKAALQAEGIRIMESGCYDVEAPVCGCGAKLDHRDFGPNGKIDRSMYYISVRPEDQDRALALLEALDRQADCPRAIRP